MKAMDPIRSFLRSMVVVGGTTTLQLGIIGSPEFARSVQNGQKPCHRWAGVL